MSCLSDISVVLPSLDPDEKLLTVIDGLLEYGFTHIILINDGSKPENLHYFEAAAQHPEVVLLHHEVNRGKGAALKTAFTWYMENRPQGAGVVTVDGDNQHHGEDTLRCAEEMLNTDSVILGVRDFSQPDVPFRSRNGNRITSAVFKIFVGMSLSDTQTGLRAIPTAYLNALTRISGDRFEYETNMLLAMKNLNIPYEEVKIRTVYIEENKSSHFRAVQDSWRIYKLILAHFFRYTLSSFLSAFIDWGVYVLLTYILQDHLSNFLLTLLPTLAARVLSSLINFFVNRKLVFKSTCPTGKALVRYFSLAAPIALGQFLLTHGAYLLFDITTEQIALRSLIYALAMTALFLISYMGQQRWVFAPKK